MLLAVVAGVVASDLLALVDTAEALAVVEIVALAVGDNLLLVVVDVVVLAVGDIMLLAVVEVVVLTFGDVELLV